MCRIPFETSCFTLRMEGEFLSRIDVEAAFHAISQKIEAATVLEDDDLMKLVILPLTIPSTDSKQKMLEKVVELAEHIQDNKQQIFILSGIIVASDEFINRAYLEQIRRKITMTQLGKMYEKEKIEYWNQRAKEKTLEINKSMLKRNIDIVDIMEVTGLTEEELLHLQEETVIL